MSSKQDRTCFDLLQQSIVLYFGEWKEISSQLPYDMIKRIGNKRGQLMSKHFNVHTENVGNKS